MSLYLIFLVVHLFAAMLWIGGTLFYVLVIFKVVKRKEMEPFKTLIIKESALEFRKLSYVIFAFLFLSGLVLVYKKHSVIDLTQGLISIKLALFLILVVSSLYHDFITGPKTFFYMENDLTKYTQYKRISSYFGRINLLLSVTIAILGILISRGIKNFF